MLVAGAKGFAKQLLEIIYQLNLEKETAFFDDYDPSEKALHEFSVLKDEPSVRLWIENHGNAFCLGVGNPTTRQMMKTKLENMGCTLHSIISPLASISRKAKIGIGTTILTRAIIETDVHLGEGVLVNISACICHDSRIGDFSEISPGALITGGCEVGSFSFIGAGAVLKPQIKIGRNVTVGAGAVITENFGDNVVLVGVPARVLRTKPSLTF